MNYAEKEQQRVSVAQHLTAEVLGSIWSGLSKGASEWEDFYSAFKQFSEVTEEKQFLL